MPRIKLNVEITDLTRTIEAAVFPEVATEFYSLAAADAMDVRRTYTDVGSFVEDEIVSGKPWALGVPEVLAGSHVFVCAHANRDKRCGVYGPVLIDKFEEEIETRGLKDQIFVRACSHIRGYKYAGNIIIFSPDAEGKIVGHWYGYVTLGTSILERERS